MPTKDRVKMTGKKLPGIFVYLILLLVAAVTVTVSLATIPEEYPGMTEHYEFTHVNSLSEDPVGQSVSFTTDTGRSCRVQDEGPGKIAIRSVRRASGEGTELFVACEPSTGAVSFAAPFNEDYISSIRPVREPEPGLQVCLVLRPSCLILPETHPRFVVLRDILYGAQEQERMVRVGTFPGDSGILDVQLTAR